MQFLTRFHRPVGPYGSLEKKEFVMIIVTGGAGFIGSAIVWKLNQRGESDVLIVDGLGRGDKWKNLRSLRFSDYIEKDAFLEKIIKGDFKEDVSALIHMGGCSSTSERDARYLIKNNYEYTKHLADYADWRDVRFIYASSAATYGDGSQGYSDDESSLERFRPLNMYGYSKHLFDLWAKRNGLLENIVGLKYFNVFGPNEYHKGEMRSVILKAYEQQIKDGRKMRLFKSYRKEYANGEQMRDFLYVKDAAEMTLFFLEHPEINGIFNIGTGVARTWNALAKAAFAALGLEPQIEYIDMPETLRDRYQYFTQADISKLRQAGYTAGITSLEDAVSDYVQNYLQPQKYLS